MSTQAREERADGLGPAGHREIPGADVGPREPATISAGLPPSPMGVLALQHGAGNRAVAALLAPRRGPPAGTPTPVDGVPAAGGVASTAAGGVASTAASASPTTLSAATTVDDGAATAAAPGAVDADTGSRAPPGPPLPGSPALPAPPGTGASALDPPPAPARLATPGGPPPAPRPPAPPAAPPPRTPTAPGRGPGTAP
ncbi:hypothetical protein ACFO3F_10585, partial [Georgenia faecalis]